MAEKLKEELREAQTDTRLRARWFSFSYRLNIPSRDESEELLTPDDAELIIRRPVADRVGQPVVGIDLGGGRAWSAATAIWSSGRCEALALAPGIPDLSAQERRDRLPRGRYSDLQKMGVLEVADGLHVPPVSALWQMVMSRWGIPSRVVCDRFRVNELRDQVGTSCILEPRISRWSEAGADIRALRRLARDGDLSMPRSSTLLILESLVAASVRNDDQGNTRLGKRDPSNNTGRDDVAAALTLAAGAHEREHNRPVQAFSFYRAPQEEIAA